MNRPAVPTAQLARLGLRTRVHLLDLMDVVARSGTAAGGPTSTSTSTATLPPASPPRVALPAPPVPARPHRPTRPAGPHRPARPVPSRPTRPARALAGGPVPGPQAAPTTAPTAPRPSGRRLRNLFRRLSLSGRLVLAATVAVGVVVTAVTWLAFLAVRHELVSDVDTQLRRVAERAERGPVRFGPRGEVPPFAGRFGQPSGYVQVVLADGESFRPRDQDVTLPVSRSTLDVAAGDRSSFLTDAQVGGVHSRVLTESLRDGAALQVAAPLDDVDRELARLEVAFVAVGLIGIAGAALLHRLMTGAVLAPVAHLTEAAERIAATRDLAHRVDTGRVEADRADELGRLATSVNAMLDALADAVNSQRQLVADASHELRTPLTSLRTNVEVLARAASLPEEDRAVLLDRIVGGIGELTGLVSDIAELARGEEHARFVEEFRLDELVCATVARAELHWPTVTFDPDLVPVLARGVPARIERAVVNLLDNAAKFSPPGGVVTVRLRVGGLTVRDRGPGIPPEDLPHVFDRFYRAGPARGLPGSGLGLAIVRQVAESHGGRVRVENATGGGTRVRFRLPRTATSPALVGPPRADSPES